MKIEIHFVDDWEALYIDGVSVTQGHDGTLEYWLQHVVEYPLTIESFCKKYHEGDLLDKYVLQNARFPDTLEKIEKIK